MNCRYFILVISSLLILFGCVQPPPTGGKTEQIIEIEAADQILNYQCQSFWTEEKFSNLTEDDLITEFKEKYNVNAVNFEVTFDEATCSTILTCDVKGEMYNTNSYNFHWLLADLPFDLYAFTQSERELNYEGEVNGVPTTIKLIFPYAIAHCHEHVWPAK